METWVDMSASVGITPLFSSCYLVSVLVGGIFLAPLLCAATAYYVFFRPVPLSSFLNWFGSPKPVLSSDHGTLLGTSDQESSDTGSEYAVVPNGAHHRVDDEPQESREVEIEAMGMDSAGAHSTAGLGNGEPVLSSLAQDEIEQEMVEESKAFEVVQEVEEEDGKVTALSASQNRLDQEEVAAFRVDSVNEGSTKDVEEEASRIGSVIGFSSGVPLLDGHEGVQGEEMDEALTLSENERGQEREDPTPIASSYEEPAEEGDSVHEITYTVLALEETLGTEEIVEEEEIPKDVVDPSNAGRAHGRTNSAPGVSPSTGLAEDQEFHALDSDATGHLTGEENQPSCGELEHFVESKAVEQEQGEGHPSAAHLMVPGEEHEYLEKSEAVEKEKEEPVQTQFELIAQEGQGHEYPEESQAVVEEPGEASLPFVGEHPFLFDEQQQLLEKPERLEEGLRKLSLLFQGKHEHSEDGLPLKHVVQQFDGTFSTEGESLSETYESASDSFSPSETEQEPDDVIEQNAGEIIQDTVHRFDLIDSELVEGNSIGSGLEEIVGEEEAGRVEERRLPSDPQAVADSRYLLADLAANCLVDPACAAALNYNASR